MSFISSKFRRSSSFLNIFSIMIASPSSSGCIGVTFGVGMFVSTCASISSATTLYTWVARVYFVFSPVWALKISSVPR